MNTNILHFLYMIFSHPRPLLDPTTPYSFNIKVHTDLFQQSRILALGVSCAYKPAIGSNYYQFLSSHRFVVAASGKGNSIELVGSV